LGFWLFGIRYAIHDLVPTDNLTNALMGPVSASSFGSLTASVKAKSLSLVQCLIAEMSWRIPPSVVDRIVEILRPLLAHPLKQVRWSAIFA
jgi:hypothetical protein